MEGAQHEIGDLSCAPGELAFTARIGNVDTPVFFRTESEADPCPEAALAAVLMPAMRFGGTLTVDAPIGPRILRNQREFQAIQRVWSRDWPFGEPPLREVDVVAPVGEEAWKPARERVAAFFSGGVDSWSTLLLEPGVTDVIFVRGADILPEQTHQEGLADRVEERLRAAAAELDLTLHVVETNARRLSEPVGPAEPLVIWDAYYSSLLAAVGLFLGPIFDRVLLTGDLQYEAQVKLGASWLVDHLWSTDNLEICDVGGRFSRVERTRAIADHPAVRKSLRVCWQNPDGAYNCGRCRKCLMTMVTLQAFGALESCETFPSEIDPELFAGHEIPTKLALTYWEEVLQLLGESGGGELEGPVAEMVARSRRDLGLPDDRSTGGAEVPEQAQTEKTRLAGAELRAETATRRANETEARAVAAEQRAAAAEAAAEAAGARLREVVGSNSWRLTEPLRRLRARRRDR